MEHRSRQRSRHPEPNDTPREGQTVCPIFALSLPNFKFPVGDKIYSPDAFDEKFKTEDTEAHMVFISLLIIQFKNVTFVGPVAEIVSNQTDISYTVRDDSGSIEVVQSIEAVGVNERLVKTQQAGFLRLGLYSSFNHEFVQQHCYGHAAGRPHTRQKLTR
ncbi:hypothetical protein GHT06_016949 [Daphnia sinensis]|uniref:Uncharacterized protein n=1 Tax=Daphnia sinensis TaxID=1820382 RepID=A0AAD5KP82_9CRUS|nr:hypothetical protein GHT06_016949 [Daphnia sinensis]